MNFFSLALRNVVRRPARSALTGIGLAVAVGAAACLGSVADGLRRSLVDRLQGSGTDALVTRARITEQLTGTIAADVEMQLRAMPEVRDVAPELVDLISFEDLNLIGVTVYGRRPGALQFRNLKLLDGRWPEAADAEAVLLGTVLAKNLDKRVGDEVSLYDDRPLPVVGIYQSYSMHENAAMIVPLAELQRQLDRRDQVTFFAVSLNEPQDATATESFRRRIEELRRGLAASTTAEFTAQNTQLAVGEAVAWLTALLAGVIGAVGVLNTMLTAVVERTRELGILRAVGWSASAVVRLILTESLVLSVCGATAGIVGAVCVLYALAQVPAGNGLVTGGVPLVSATRAAGLALAMGLLGAIYPAWHGARISPCEAVRHE